jgi:hypothetical protein
MALLLQGLDESTGRYFAWNRGLSSTTRVDPDSTNNDTTDFPRKGCRNCGKRDRPQFRGTCSDGHCDNFVDDYVSDDEPEIPESGKGALVLHPALLARYFKYSGEIKAHRIERMLLYLNQEGSSSSRDIGRELGLSYSQVYYNLKRGPFRLEEETCLWSALRVSKKWELSNSVDLFGEPKYDVT